MLQLRLPLNKDLRNIGCAVSATSSSGAVLSAANNAYSFDGTDDYISVSGITSCFKGGTNPFSVSFWFYHSGNSRRGVLFGNYGLVGSNRFNIEITAANLLRLWWDGSPDWTVSTFSIPTKTWIYCTIVYDGTSIKVYKDGVLNTTRSGVLATKNPSGVYYLGRDSRTGVTAFQGLIRDFRVYDHALSVKEIHELNLGLFLHYKFDYIANDFYKQDYSGFDHNIILANGAPQLQGDSPVYKNAMKMNGSTGFISEEFYTPESCTYCVWVKKTAGSSTCFMIDARKSNNGVQPIYTSGSTLQVYSSSGGSNNYSIPSIPSGVWQHYAVTLSAAGNKLYINGQLVTQGNNAKGMNVLTYISLGMRHSQATYLNGAMCDVRMYAKELSAEDIFNIYRDTIMIDNEQNLYCKELIEGDEDANSFVKTGVVKTNEFIEGASMKIFEDALETKQIYEI